MAGAVMVNASTGVMNSLLGKLATLMGDEYAKIKGVRKQVGFLKDELSSMNALLEKLADVEELDPQHKEWRNQVREMAYDIEDFIDDFMRHQTDPSAKVGFLGKAVQLLKELKMRPRFADQIRDLKDRVKEVSERRIRYRLDDCISTCRHVDVDPRMPALYAEVASIVGMGSPKGELIKRLMEGEGESMRQLKVLSIFGFGGLGKTCSDSLPIPLGEQSQYELRSPAHKEKEYALEGEFCRSNQHCDFLVMYLTSKLRITEGGPTGRNARAVQHVLHPFRVNVPHATGGRKNELCVD